MLPNISQKETLREASRVVPTRAPHMAYPYRPRDTHICHVAANLN